MSEWIDCPKCGEKHEDMCICIEPLIIQPDEEKIMTTTPSPTKETMSDTLRGAVESFELAALLAGIADDWNLGTDGAIETSRHHWTKCSELKKRFLDEISRLQPLIGEVK